MEADLHELAEQATDQIRKQSPAEFSIKEQGHQIEPMGKSFDNLQLQVEGCINHNYNFVFSGNIP